MTIAEVSKKYGLTADTLRYYERVGLIPKVNRNKNGIRNYTEQDCRNVEFVTLLQQGDETVEARRDILIEQRKELVKKMKEIKTTIDRLDYKIDRYESLVKKESELKQY